MGKRIGILGGCFDPIHWGHILLAREAMSFMELNCVLLLVAKDPPHKTTWAAAEDRFEMARLAAQDEVGLYACDLEWNTSGGNYIIYTIRKLKKYLPDAELFYIIGGDELASLPHWYGYEELISLVKILCVVRLGKWGLPSDLISRIQNRYGIPACVMDAQLPDISSTEVKKRLQSDLPVSQYVPAAIEKYILDHRLYQPSPIRGWKEKSEEL